MWNCFERSDCIRIDTECWNVFKNLSRQIYKVLFRVQLPLIDDYYYKNENEKKKKMDAKHMNSEWLMNLKFDPCSREMKIRNVSLHNALKF